MHELPPLEALRVFAAAARSASFAKAAAALHLTPSAVSHRIKALEEQLGTALFERRVRAVKLTEHGRRYAAAVEEALALLREATRRVRPAGGWRPLTLSVSPISGARWLLPRLARFEAQHPELTVQMISTNRLADFVEDGVDAAVRLGLGRWPGLAAHFLMDFDLVPVCAPALLRSRGPLRTPGDLVRLPLLYSDLWPESWHIWLHAAGVRDPEPATGRHFQDMATALEAAVAGLGVAITGRRFVENEIADGRLVISLDKELPSGMAFYLVYPESRTDEPRIAALRTWLVTEFTPQKSDRGPQRRTLSASARRRSPSAERRERSQARAGGRR
jgi:LysR family glycine cleavage system transcriptional activator